MLAEEVPGGLFPENCLLSLSDLSTQEKDPVYATGFAFLLTCNFYRI
jgi:hypothetical protein